MSSEDRINPVHTLLHHTQAKDLVPGGRSIYSLLPSASVEEAVQTLKTHKIQSCPVIKGKSCVGLVDMLDIASYVVSVAPSEAELMTDHLKRLEMAGRAIALVPISQVIDLSGRDPLVPIFDNSPASQVNAVFAGGVHHVVIFHSTEDKVENVISQSDLLKFLKEHLHVGESKIIGQKTLKELSLGQATPVSIAESQTVIEALRTIQSTKVSCLAVVNAEGRLVGNFSASDLVGLYTEHFPSFESSMTDFLSEHSPKSLSPILAYETNTLIETANTLVENNIHHLWVVDADYKPTGIVSITDIARVIQTYQYY